MIAGTVQSLICSYRTLLQVLQLGRALQIKSCSYKLRKAYAMLRCLSCPVLGCSGHAFPLASPQRSSQGLFAAEPSGAEAGAEPPSHVQAQGELCVRHQGFVLERFGQISLTQAVLFLSAAQAAAALRLFEISRSVNMEGSLSWFSLGALPVSQEVEQGQGSPCASGCCWCCASDTRQGGERAFKREAKQ